MIDPIVRRATTADSEQLQFLEAEARRALVGQRGAERWLELRDAVGDRWAHVIQVGGVAVGLIDRVIVGYIVWSRAAHVVKVDDVYVTPGARELGFGDELLATALADARAAGATYFEGESLPGDRATKNLYERAAIKARLLTTSIEL